MTWRSQQLGQDLCAQDRLILSLFDNQPVVYQGLDTEFARHLQQVAHAPNIIVVLNHAFWLSDFCRDLEEVMSQEYTKIYLGVNRYQCLGNDIDWQPVVGESAGANLITLARSIARCHAYKILNSGTQDQDQGQLYNWVQPLTWAFFIKHDQSSSDL